MGQALSQVLYFLCFASAVFTRAMQSRHYLHFTYGKISTYPRAVKLTSDKICIFFSYQLIQSLYFLQTSLLAFSTQVDYIMFSNNWKTFSKRDAKFSPTTSFRASDLVMKVDALLSAQPKGDARIEYQFFEDRHRYRISVEFVIFTFTSAPLFFHIKCVYKLLQEWKIWHVVFIYIHI